MPLPDVPDDSPVGVPIEDSSIVELLLICDLWVPKNMETEIPKIAFTQMNGWLPAPLPPIRYRNASNVVAALDEVVSDSSQARSYFIQMGKLPFNPTSRKEPEFALVTITSDILRHRVFCHKVTKLDSMQHKDVSQEDRQTGASNSIGAGQELFAGLSLDEKREALDLDDAYLESILDARCGKGHVFDLSGTQANLVNKMSDDDLIEAILLVRLHKKAQAASQAGRHLEAIRFFSQIIDKAPFDSLSLMSMGVQYAYVRDGRKAVEFLKRALASDPANQRIRDNLQAVQADFGM